MIIKRIVEGSQLIMERAFTTKKRRSQNVVITKKHRSQNVVIRLNNRQIHSIRRRCSPLHCVRQFYQNVFPNFSIIDVGIPECFLRTFSPDGRLFIAFSDDWKSLEVYLYNGPTAAADLLVLDEYENDIFGKLDDIKDTIFGRFFTFKFRVDVAKGTEKLNGDCSLFTDDGRYVIIGSVSFIPDEIRPHFYEIYTNNESVTPNVRAPLRHYTLHLVDLHLGRLCDSRKFKVDRILLTRNQGLYLYEDTLAVLSMQHQVIHIFQILDGMFLDVLKIGRFCCEEDSLMYNKVYSSENAFREVWINSLKQRLLTFLYRRAAKISATTNNPTELRKFHHYFEDFNSLKMWKMQLLDQDHLFIKYASEEVVTFQGPNTFRQPQYFVLYNLKSTNILAVYENNSNKILDLFEKFCATFRSNNSSNKMQFVSSLSNNIHARFMYRRLKQIVIKFGGKSDAIKRFVTELPISAQSYNSSPYLDFSLFSYDDKLVSALETPNPYCKHPIRFYSRDSGFFKFVLYTSPVNETPCAKQLVEFKFHPSDPFAISVRKTNTRTYVNLHIRHYHFYDEDSDEDYI